MIRRRSFLLTGFLATRVQARELIPASNVERLHQAIRAARPGDTIVMGDGFWTNTDIGCIQLQDGSGVRGRLSAAETGPDWLGR